MSGPAPNAKRPLMDWAIELVVKKDVRADRLLDREIELIGSVLPELVAELLQIPDKEE